MRSRPIGIGEDTEQLSLLQAHLQRSLAFVGNIVPCRDTRTSECVFLVADSYLQVARLERKVIHVEQVVAIGRNLAVEPQHSIAVVEAGNVFSTRVVVSLHRGRARALRVLGLIGHTLAQTVLQRCGTGRGERGAGPEGRTGKTVIHIPISQVLGRLGEPSRVAEALGVDIVVGMEGIGQEPRLILRIVEHGGVHACIAHQNAFESLEVAIGILAHAHHAVAVAERCLRIGNDARGIGLVLLITVVAVEEQSPTQHRTLVIGRSPCVAVGHRPIGRVEYHAVVHFSGISLVEVFPLVGIQFAGFLKIRLVARPQGDVACCHLGRPIDTRVGTVAVACMLCPP